MPCHSLTTNRCNRAKVPLGLQNRVRTSAHRPVLPIVIRCLWGIKLYCLAYVGMCPVILTEAGTDKVGAMTMPYAAPEVMGTVTDRAVLLDASMDVWSMAIVLIQAITRRTTGPTEHDVSVNGVPLFSLDNSSKHVMRINYRYCGKLQQCSHATTLHATQAQQHRFFFSDSITISCCHHSDSDGFPSIFARHNAFCCCVYLHIR